MEDSTLKRGRAAPAFIIVGLVALVVMIAAAGPAKRTEASIDYQVVPYNVCNWQYPSPGLFVGASSWNPWSAYSLYCYRVGLGVAYQWLGGLNIQGYCAAHYRGSRAVVVRDDWYALDDWYCRVG